MTDNEILEQATKESDKWIQVFSLDGATYDKAAVEADLKARKFEDKPVYAIVVDSPQEVQGAIQEHFQAILDFCEQDANSVKAELAKANQYIWGYYDMAFYEIAYKFLPDKSKLACAEFFEQSLFDSFKNGLGFLVNLGSLLIGIMRPTAYRDETLRLHKADGPAIIWNTIKEYWWHGVKVEEEWIEHPEKITGAQAMKISNIEQRRALCEIIGWDRVIESLESKVISEDNFGTLLECTVDGTRSKFVRVVCPSTERNYVIPVDNSAKTAHEAVAMTFNEKPEDYDPVIET